MSRPTPERTASPYTTLFRSRGRPSASRDAARLRASSWWPAAPSREARPPARRTDRARPARSVRRAGGRASRLRSEEHTSELQSHHDLVCRLLLEKKKKK